jgi:hypothetical protein
MLPQPLGPGYFMGARRGTIAPAEPSFIGGVTNFFSRLTSKEQKEVEIRISAWRFQENLMPRLQRLGASSPTASPIATAR